MGTKYYNLMIRFKKTHLNFFMDEVSIIILASAATILLSGCVFCFCRFCCSIFFNREIVEGVDAQGNRIILSRNIHTLRHYVVTDYFIQEEIEKPFTIEKNNDPEKMCIICMEDMGETECKLKCGHSYHLGCIREWAYVQRQNSCPQCRESILKIDSIV